MLSVRNVVKLTQVYGVGMVEELAQLPPEYHVDDDTNCDFQETNLRRTKRTEKGKYLI